VLGRNAVFCRLIRLTVAGLWLATLCAAAPFGRVVAIGGQAADLALDEGRQVLYVANLGANRVDVVSLASQTVTTSFNVLAQPSSLALSPDGRWLLVTHYGQVAAPAPSRNGLTVLDLRTSARQTIALAGAPFGVAFGADGLALVVTATEFLEFDPASGATRLIQTISNLQPNELPRPVGSAPPSISGASLAASEDGRWIYGLSENLRFRYDVINKRAIALGYSADPPFGPRAVAVDSAGTAYVMGWGLFSRAGALLSQFPDPSGLLGVGGHAFDTRRGLIYSQVLDSRSKDPANLPPPELQVVRSDNLEVVERLRLPENLAGKGVLSSDGSMAFILSESGVMFLPVGRLAEERRVTALQEDLLLTSSGCSRQVLTGSVTVADLSGQATWFSASSDNPAVTLSQSSRFTPAVLEVSVDPSRLTVTKGTIVATVTLNAPDSVRVLEKFRVLVQLKDPDQRGTTINVPGKLVDLVADPVRDRFYVLRQDRNRVMVFDGSSYQQIATLRTGNTPTQMAITLDRRHLLVGNDNAQVANVFNLDTLQAEEAIVFPGGHYPRSLASTGRRIIASTRVAGPNHKIDWVDFDRRVAQEYPTLGPWENKINLDSVTVASLNGATAMTAQADGNLLLYNSVTDSFTVSRRDSASLGGAYGPMGDEGFVVGNNLLNRSLVVSRRFGSATDLAAGFAPVDGMAVRATQSGLVERADLSTGALIRPTRSAEAPAAADVGAVFRRTVAPLANRRAIVTLTISGLTVLAWDYDAAVALPRIERLQSSADGSADVAPGSLVSLYGTNLSPISLATREMPLPSALGESCLTVNGIAMPMLFVSPDQINAQMPFTVTGPVTISLRTPAGISDDFNGVVFETAPGVFRLTVPGLDGTAPAVYNARNGGLATGSNPLKRGDRITIFLTGLGRTQPPVASGLPAPQPAPRAIAPVAVLLGETPLSVDFAGLTPGQVGVYQVNAEVPRNAPVGVSIPLEINQGGRTTRMNVRVIE
jgi:uncharacterized protein (TIGR03437 family)